MDESSYLDPAALQAQCGGAIQVLESDKEAIYILENSLDSFINDGEIQGASFAAMKQQISDYKTVLQAIVTAHESDKMDFEALKGAAVGEVLDGSKIIPNKKKAKEKQEEYERRAEEYRNLASSLPTECSWMSSIFNGYAYYYSKLAEIERGLYEKWKEKEENYDAIEAATSGLFSASGGMRAAIDSALSGINGAFRVAEGRYEIDWSAPWRGEIGTAKISLVKKQLNLMGIEPERVQELTDMGFTYDGLWGYRLMCQNEQEKEFYIQVLLGTEESYIKAFEINPNELNAGMTIFMADYACRLLELNDDETATEESVRKIMEFNNAVLQSEAYCVDESDQITMRKYRDVYIEKLLLGTSFRLEEMVYKTALADPGDWNYSELKREYVENLAMLLLWNAEGGAIRGLENVYEAEDQDCSILNLKFDKNKPTFSIQHYSPWNGSIVSEKIKTFYDQDTDINDDYTTAIIAYNELEKRQERVYWDFMQSLVTDIGITALAMAAPECAIPVSLLMMAIDGKAGTVTGLDSFATDSIRKFEIKSGNILVKDVINSYSNWSSIQNEWDQLDKDNYFKWFGSYLGYEVLQGDGVLDAKMEISMRGIYNPNILRRKMLWENQGMEAWANLNGYTEAQIIQEITDSEEYDNALKNDMIALLEGENGIFETMPMERFVKAMDQLDEITGDNSFRRQFLSFKKGEDF